MDEPALTKSAIKELTEILNKQFSSLPVGYPTELVEDFGVTLLKLSATALKRRLKINKEKNTL